MIADLIADRRRTTDLIHDLKSRLNELILLEVRGLEDTPIAGIVDLHNERNAQLMINNIERQAATAIKKIEKEAELTSSPPEKTGIPKAEIEAEKEKVVKKTRRSGLSVDKAAGIIAHILKEKGIPMKSKDLYELVNEQLESPITRANFSNNVLPRSARINSKINNVSHGYWQYLNN